MTERHIRIPEDKVEGKPLGRHINHDQRSLRYAVQATAAEPVSVEHERFIPILDQGELGSCTGNAGTGSLGSHPIYETLDPSTVPESLDEDYAVQLYSDATVADDYPGDYPPEDTGCDGLTICKVLKNRGLISGYQAVTSLGAAYAGLQQGTLITGINWLSTFDDPDEEGVVSITDDSYVRGGHEILVVGYDADKDLFKFANSWGTSYGKDGYFYMSSADYETVLLDQGDAYLLIPATDPAPVPIPDPVDPTPTPDPQPEPTPVTPIPTPEPEPQPIPSVPFPMKAVTKWLDRKHYTHREQNAADAIELWLRATDQTPRGV